MGANVLQYSIACSVAECGLYCLLGVCIAILTIKFDQMNECKKEKRGGICFYNIDNIEFMKTKPDDYYDLAIVDPPYGIKQDVTQNNLGGKKGFNKESGTYNRLG
jgi:hypothetical protein